MTLPTASEIENLHKKYAPDNNTFTEVWQHCKIVRTIAVWCMDNKLLTMTDKKLVETGCLVHDLGVYRLYGGDGSFDSEHYIRHGILGYELLKDEGFDEILCRFASHHTGVGITAKEIVQNNLSMPHRDYLAETPEERLVMYADKFHSKKPSHFNSVQYFEKQLLNQFGQNKVSMFENMITEFGIPPIKDMAQACHQVIR